MECLQLPSASKYELVHQELHVKKLINRLTRKEINSDVRSILKSLKQPYLCQAFSQLLLSLLTLYSQEFHPALETRIILILKEFCPIEILKNNSLTHVLHFVLSDAFASPNQAILDTLLALHPEMPMATVEHNGEPVNALQYYLMIFSPPDYQSVFKMLQACPALAQVNFDDQNRTVLHRVLNHAPFEWEHENYLYYLRVVHSLLYLNPSGSFIEVEETVVSLWWDRIRQSEDDTGCVLTCSSRTTKLCPVTRILQGTDEKLHKILGCFLDQMAFKKLTKRWNRRLP